MKKIIKTFKDVFELPLKLDIFWPAYIITNNNVIVFNILKHDLDLINKILDIINGNSNEIIKNEIKYQDCKIVINNIPIFLIRGWGYLTGPGGLGLSTGQAVIIQEDFVNWIIDKLQGKL